MFFEYRSGSVQLLPNTKCLYLFTRKNVTLRFSNKNNIYRSNWFVSHICEVSSCFNINPLSEPCILLNKLEIVAGRRVFWYKQLEIVKNYLTNRPEFCCGY
ncbi:unnamed protein product [Acanthoscelides obtectus]|uniref:Uncharacterized protein n=1 Tax=Acanthoscelides obtectus TaxID=200917 RepID=A0A9P0PES0_ACAOB|nr:unnamed protein product [Acanthoscelides obtectus]CAK1681467.1 hypothetical protein AOBTE_LOCUS33139 [Acanthoscelides obtectus]